MVVCSILPVAGMREQNGEFSCEDGQLECTGHRWQACAINKDKDDVAKYVGSVAVRPSSMVRTFDNSFLYDSVLKEMNQVEKENGKQRYPTVLPMKNVKFSRNVWINVRIHSFVR